LERVLPAIEALNNHFPEAWLSVDTYHSKVATEAVLAGASIINDVSSGSIDSNMIATVAQLQVPYIAMHMQGTPATMQQNPLYNNVTQDILDYLKEMVDKCEAAGIKDIIIDPGFGFGKTLEHNYELLRNMHTMHIIGKPVLAGISRKGMIWKVLDTNPDGALNGTTALHMVALQQGANILRAHDVKEATETIKLYKWLK
jgi:dihydropteroate synthase